MKKLFSIAFITVLLSCSATKVNYDYDKSTDFSSYNTYNYFNDLETGFSELDEKRFLNAVAITLQSKGLKFSEEPDIFIDIKSTVYRSRSNNSVGLGLGGGGSTIGGGVSVGIPVGEPKLTRELQIDFVDAKKDMLIWQSVSTSPFKEGEPPALKEKNIQELVAKIFDKYPPKAHN
ncbi:DUF4136 domain-containing protein [Maribacter sp. CXY002]|uniref:DUF4136 domain-containing protein n=1 Tax=Maribacter luteocoastalis TaxID=3407671 RepID=UPI003B67D0B1